MKPYSMDLRERVARAVDRREGSLRLLARRFFVSVTFIARLLRHRRQTGSLEPQPHGGGRQPALDPAACERLRQCLQQHPEATLDELRQQVGVPCSRMAVARALRRLKIPRKQISR